MRVLGLLGLVLALVIVGLVVKKQLSGMAATSLPNAPAAASGAPPSNVRGQSQQIQQQFKQSLDAAMQSRPKPDDN